MFPSKPLDQFQFNCLPSEKFQGAHSLQIKQKITTWTKIHQTPTDQMTMNRNLRREQKMKTDQVNHPFLDSTGIGRC